MIATLNPLVWIAPIVLLVLFWPLAQRFRHDKLNPIAAYLLFTSVFALVGSGAFTVAVWIGVRFLSAGTMKGPLAAAVAILIAVLPAFAAAVWTIIRPQKQRMPR